MGNFLKKYQVALIVFALLFLSIEISIRYMGVVSFPLYTIDSKKHYYLNPDQSGTFLNKNKWFVNSNGFNNKEQIDTSKPYIMLVGDSVVYGGNPVDYNDRIGYQLDSILDKNVYIGAVGGWSLYNEIEFINKNIDIANRSDFIVIQYDNGDLDDYAKSVGGLVHPTQKPYLATYFLLEKYVYPKIFKSSKESELPPIPEEVKSNGNWKNELLAVSNNTGKKILFVLYPDQKAFSNLELWNKQTKDIRNFISKYPNQFDYIDIAETKGWSLNLYRDGIHPNVEGNKLIALDIANYLKTHKL